MVKHTGNSAIRITWGRTNIQHSRTHILLMMRPIDRIDLTRHADSREVAIRIEGSGAYLSRQANS